MDERLNVLVDLGPLVHQVANLLVGVDHGGVISAAEDVSGLGVGEIGEFPKEVHADLSCGDQGTPATLGDELVDGKAVLGRCRRQDLVRGDGPQLTAAHDVAEHLFSHGQRGCRSIEVGIGGHPVECALDLTDVVGDVSHDELEDHIGDRGVGLLGLFADDGETSLQVRRLDVGDQAHLEPGPETALQDVIR